MDGFQCCLSEISRANLVFDFNLPCIFSKKHVMWRTCVTLGSQSWWVGVICRSCHLYVDLLEVADPAHWSWLSPTTDWNRQGRKAFLMTPPEFWLTYIACVYLDGLLQGLRFKFFGARWNPSTIKSWCWGFFDSSPRSVQLTSWGAPPPPPPPPP